MAVDRVGGDPENPSVTSWLRVPIWSLVAVAGLSIPVLMMARGCPTRHACHCKYARTRTVRAPSVVEPPTLRAAPSWESRCRVRLESVANDLVASPFAHRGLVATPAGHIAVESGGPQGKGLFFHVSGPNGIRYGAGVSDLQQGEIADTDWYSLNAPAKAVDKIDKMSFFRDYHGRSGFYAGLDPDDTSLAWFSAQARAAIDGCLEEDPQ